MTTDGHPNTRPTSTGRRPNDLTNRARAAGGKVVLLGTTLTYGNHLHTTTNDGNNR
ncbi:hypothetical protein [Nocardiopsis synnemataformans]|uniref:hypothetical protein n=1 Tax=Nocardiopsis synnemataformans TaxID=61305 RepID=UPI003EBBC03B